MAGQVVAERFRLGAVVGAGGMGVVYEAEDLLEGGKVALKLLRSEEVVDVTRFQREASLLAQLQHPGIVRYVAHGVVGREGGELAGRVWLAMEWLEGRTLAEAIQRGAIDAHGSVEVVRRAAAALVRAHERGVVHRDLKPANLFLCGGEPEGTRVLDFGIARSVAAGHTLTATGATIGTPHYMSPEQARADRRVDPSTDVYALGVVLYECLAGQRPFDGDTPLAVLAKILLEDPPPLEGYPDDLSALLAQLLSKDPAERPADAAALEAALGTLDLSQLAGRRGRPSMPPALGTSEQRLICVVMVADVGGYGASAPTVLSTDERSGNLHGELRELAQAHGASVELVADGSMVATIGARGVATDQAERAARLALALRAVLPDAPIAVVAGRSVVTSRLPAGQVIDRGAAALSEGAGGVRIDDVVDGLLDERFAREGDPGARTLLGVQPRERASRQLLGREIPCVGRRRELATLGALFEEAAEEPVARAVWLEAPAGGGKTRVVQEFLGSLEDDHVLLAGAADAMQGAPYAALASAIRRSVGILDGEPLEIRRRKLAGHLARVAAGAERAELTVFLGELVRVPFPDDTLPELRAARHDPQLMRDALRSALVGWVRLEAARAPVVLVLEDLQWADQPTVQLVGELLQALEEEPLFVLATGRPEAAERFPQLWAERDVQQLRLTKLTRRASTKLVRAALPDATDAVVEAIVERAEGNAFFLEELVRAAAPHQGGTLHTLELPDSVLGMVEARLASMDAEGRRVLRAASVLGVHFWGGAAERLLGAADAGAASTSRWLLTLAEQEWIRGADGSRIAGESEWVFRQAAVRDAAYAMLTDEDRALGHRLAADWLEGVWAERRGVPDPEALAQHLALADQPARAARAFVEAARAALDASDLERASELAAFGQAELARAPDEQLVDPLSGTAVLSPDLLAGAEAAVDDPRARLAGELALVAAEAARWRGEYAPAAAFARDAIAQLPAGSAARFQALGNALIAAGFQGDAGEVDLLAQQVEREPATDRDAGRERLIALCRAAHQMLGRGEVERADALIAAIGVRASGDVIADAWVETTAAARALHVGALSDYLDHTERAIAAYEAARDRRHASNQRVRLAYGWLEIGRIEDARATLQIAVDEARALGLSLVLGFARQNLGWAHALGGDLAGGRAIEQEALELGRQLGSAPVIGGAHFYLSRIARRAGDAAAALDHAERALEAVDAIPPLRTLCVAARALARRALGQPSAEDARAAYAGLGTLVGMEGERIFVWRVLLECEAADEAERAAAGAALEERASAMREEHRAAYLAHGEAARLRALLSA